jgi:Ca2+-binding EF-hand superfamily protein
LKSDFNGLSDEKKASIDYQKVQTEIDEISDTYDVLTDTMNPDKTYAKDAKYYPGKKNYEIYIDLESRVATQRAAMLGNDEKISTGKTAAQADVASLLASVKDEITNLQYAGYDLLNADYKATADKEIADYKAQLTELQTQVTAFQSGITGISDGSLLVLIENKTIADKQAELTEEYEALAKAIAESKAPYQNNLNAYNAALTKLEASAKVLNDAKTKVGDDFAGKELTRQRSTYTIADTQDAIDAQEEALKTGASTLSYKKEEPDELTVNGLKVDVIAALFIKRNEQQQLLDKLTALKSESGLYTEVASLLDPNSDYLDVTYEDLNNELTKIGKSIEASQKSINGQYADAIDEARYDEYNATKGFGETKNSVFTTFDEVKAQAATDYDAIDKALNELKSKIAANKYIVGDLDGDSEVSVNDFAQLRLVVLGLSETPEDGTSQFTLFDVNSDGRINVADLQAVVNQMKAATQTTASKVARKVARVQNASADEVALSVSGEGINRRLAIALNNNAQYVGAQFDLVLPEGLSVDGATGTSRVAGFDVATNRLSDGTLRVLISSPEGLTIEGNAGTIVFVDLTVSPEYNGAAISIEHAIAADAKANGYDLTVAGEATGISTVTTTEYIKGKVYNVGGQLLNGLKKGVNIIRGNDGSTKKVYK